MVVVRTALLCRGSGSGLVPAQPPVPGHVALKTWQQQNVSNPKTWLGVKLNSCFQVISAPACLIFGCESLVMRWKQENWFLAICFWFRWVWWLASVLSTPNSWRGLEIQLVHTALAGTANISSYRLLWWATVTLESPTNSISIRFFSSSVAPLLSKINSC